MNDKPERRQGFSELLAAIHCLDGKVDTNTAAVEELKKDVKEVKKEISEWRGGITAAKWVVGILLAVGGFTLGIIRLVSK